MKREAIIFLFLTTIVFYASIVAPVAERKLEAKVIPEDAIRLRILAHSNSEQDQVVKRIIRDKVRAEITSWIEHYRTHEEAKAEIEKRLPQIEALVETELQKAGLNIPSSVQLGIFSFPTKLYGHIVYPAGEYETVLITLGDGLGANWWCVLFPPLCFLDIDNGEAVKNKEEESFDESDEEEQDDRIEESDEWNEEQEEDIEVSFLIGEWFSNLWIKLTK